jgi:CRP-like cAMP-binding protein
VTSPPEITDRVIMRAGTVDLEGLTHVPFLAGLPPGPLARIAAGAEERTFPAGHVLLQQHARVDVVHVLMSGAVQVLIRFGTSDDLLVSVLRESGALIGWSAFRAPYRS